MAETVKSSAKTDPDAERRKREEQEALHEQMLKEEQEMKAKQAITPEPAPSNVVPLAPSARLVMKADLVRKADERFQAYSIIVDGVDTKGDVRAQVQAILEDPAFLWPVHNRLQRFCEVILHDSLFNWEVRARVARMDADLHLVQLTQTGPVVIAQNSGLTIKWDEVQIVNRGASAKWSLIYKGGLMKDGFESQEAAEKFLLMKRIAA